MKSFYLLLIAGVISFTSCRTKEGEPGPAGESSLNKQGSVTGTITYTDDNGNDATTSFNYGYFESLENNKYYWYDEDGEYYGIQFERRDLKDENNYFSFLIAGDATNGVEDDPYTNYANFSLYKVINNELYEFDDDDIEVTNVKLDHTTGRLTFDFAGSVYSDGEYATVTGKVDVILNRTREYIGGGA